MRAGLLAIAFALASPAAYARSPVEACLAIDQRLSHATALPRTTAALAANGPLRIVAISSSSTVGLWQSDSALTYPGRLKAEFRQLRPDLAIEIVNSGRNADTIPGNIARFSRDVIAHRPDLVLWQIGTNDITWLHSADSLTGRIVDGIRQLKAAGAGAGADVILIDQQYAPAILASNYTKMQASIADAAVQEGVPLFSRFDLMRRTVESGVPITALTTWDGLHSTADGYACVGRALARAIVAAMPAEKEKAPTKRPRGK